MTPRITQIFYISFVAKLILAAFIPLSLDEMYYWLWGQFPQLSYFDHPPMVGWVMVLGDYFKPIADGAIRWPFVLISQMTALVWYFILKPVVNEKHLILWLLVALLNPLWGLGGLIATPDIPVVFFWSLAFLFSTRIINSPSWLNYGVFGATLGLGFLSKYMIVLFPLCMLPWFYKDKLFKLLWNKKSLFAVLTALIFCSPVLIWNYQNEFASLSFQWKHGTVAKVWRWNWSVEYLLGQIFLIFPFILYITWNNRKLSNQFFYFSLVPLIFFFVTSLFNRVEANWPIIAYPAVYATAFLNISGHEKFVKWLLSFWSGLLLFSLFLVAQGPSSDSSAKNLKIHEAEKFQNILEYSKDKNNIVTSSYQMAAYLSFHRNELICKLPEIQGRVDFFNYLKECKYLNDNLFVITKNKNRDSIKLLLPQYNISEPDFIDKNFVSYKVRRK